MMKFKILITFMALSLSACQGLEDIDSALSPNGKIAEHISKMDKQRIVSMTPAFTKASTYQHDAEFGLYWEENKKDRAFLQVELGSYVNFSPKMPIEFSVDGNRFSLKPVSTSSTGKSGKNYTTTKSYWIPKEKILEIANGSNTFYKLYYLDDTYSEGEVTYKYRTYRSHVPRAFNDFYTHVWGDNK